MPKRSKFSLGFTKLLSCDMGELIPIGLTEVLPGDTIQHATSALVRCSPMLAPVMHPVHVAIHHWFVPHRLIWSEFEDFITGGPDGLNASVFPTINTGAGFALGSLADYLGVPPSVASRTVSALPFRAYALIWNENYRDQDLQTKLAISLASGVDATTSTVLQNGAWEKDYFTSARPWEQKGPAISIPLGTTAPVTLVPHTTSVNNMIAKNVSTGANVTTGGINMAATPGLQHSSGAPNIVIDPNGRLQTDLSGASAITVTALRQAMALQRFEEARARYGSRYTEYLRYLGVRSSDARLNRPEFLGGGKQTIQFSEVLQTAEGTDPVGDLKGHGIGAMKSNRYRRFFEEHGYIVSLMVTRPKTIYVNGLARTWNRRTKEEFFQKELEHIGQQVVKNKEVYLAHSVPDGTFGYTDRYSDYRQSVSNVAGEFRTSLLDFWHLGRVFVADPALNASFVSCVPTERVFAVPSQDVLYVHARHSIQARRIVSGSSASYIY